MACLSLCGRWPAPARFVALAFLGAAALAPVVLLWPECLQSPYAAVDPVVRSLWLDHVGENLTLRADFAVLPNAALLMAVPVLIGLLGALVGACASRGVARGRWLFLAAVIAMGFATACLSLRVFSSTMPLAALGLLAPAVLVRQGLSARGDLLAAATGFAVLLVTSSFGVALALPELPPAEGVGKFAGYVLAASQRLPRFGEL